MRACNRMLPYRPDQVYFRLIRSVDIPSDPTWIRDKTSYIHHSQ